MEDPTESHESTSSPFPFLHVIEHLKRTDRKGWVIRQVESPESVSDHMYRMAIMIWMTPGIEEETRTRAMKMALVHDMGEALIGDIAPSDKIPKEEKRRRERLALQYLACLAEPVNPTFAKEIEKLWSEYEEGASEVAQLVKGTDALECMDQAVLYEERSQRGLNLSEFMQLEQKVETPELKNWTAHLKQERETLRHQERSDMVLLFVIGGPGAGKGTQCFRLARDFGCVHISVGDLLREEAQSPTSKFADFINESISESVTIPADLTIRLLQKKMDEFQLQGRRMFVIDGFPRSLDQAYAFEEKIHEQSFAIVLDCSEEVMLQRLAQRAESSGRIDDNTDSIMRRLRTFADENSKVEKHLQQMGRFWKIDANASVDSVYSSVKAVVEEIIRKG